MFFLLPIIGWAIAGGIVGGTVGALVGLGIDVLFSPSGKEIMELADWCEQNNHPILRKVLIFFNRVRGAIRKQLVVNTNHMKDDEAAIIHTETRNLNDLPPEVQQRMLEHDSAIYDVTDEVTDLLSYAH